MFDKSIQVCSRYQHLELTFCQRLQSLKLQVDSIADNEEQQEMIETLSKIHIEQKGIRGDRLLQEQCQLLRDKQRKQELQTYEKRILDLRYLQMRKEQQLWDQTWVGKRVKYSCLFQLNRVQLDQEHDQAILLMSQLIRKNAVEKQIEKLSQCLKKEQKMVEEADFRRVEKKELELLFQEHQKNEKLTALCSQLESQLQQISSEHEDFIHKYKSLTSTMSQIEAQTSGSSDKEYSCGGSGKTISTTSEEQN